MNHIQIILNINGLNCLLFGALFVFMPKFIVGFLSSTDPMPLAVLLILGVILNLYGLFLLWLGSKPEPNTTAVKLVAIGDFIWVIGTAVLLMMQRWITEINGITAAGMVAIVVGWLGWQQWQYATKK